MPEPLRILAGDCTVTYEDADETRRKRGNVVALCKPDNCGELLVVRLERARRVWTGSVPEAVDETSSMVRRLFYT